MRNPPQPYLVLQPAILPKIVESRYIPSRLIVVDPSDTRYGNTRAIFYQRPRSNLHARHQFLKSEPTGVITGLSSLLMNVSVHTSTPRISTTRTSHRSSGNRICTTCQSDRAKRVVPTHNHIGHPDNRPLDSTWPYSYSRFAPYQQSQFLDLKTNAF